MLTRLLAVAAVVAMLLATGGSIASATGTDVTTGAVHYHPVNPGYTAIKAALDARGPQAPGGGSIVSSGSTTSPAAGPSWQGLGANGSSPSDATGAIGPTEYVELINEQIGVYDRGSLSLLSSNSEAGFTGFSSASGDGQILWDPAANRYFIAMLNSVGSNSYDLLWGFSKGMSPSASASDWCTYHSNFGAYGTNQLPDYPKLGTTQNFLLIGVNHFTDSASNWNYVGSDVAWVGKPAVGTATVSTCPGAGTTGIRPTLKNADGSDASTPVPGRQTIWEGRGYCPSRKFRFS